MMNSKSIAPAIIAFLVVVAGAAFILLQNTGNTHHQDQTTTSMLTSTQRATQQPVQTVQNSTSVLFNSTGYAKYSYLISSANLSPQAQSALAGFKLSRNQLSNGTVELSISLDGSSQNSTVMLKPGYKMYIVETAFGDDGYSFDSSLGDDGFVMVDPNGYVVA